MSGNTSGDPGGGQTEDSESMEADDPTWFGAVSSTVERRLPDAIRRSYTRKFAVGLLVMGLLIGSVWALATADITATTKDVTQDRLSDFAEQEATAIWQIRQSQAETIRLMSDSRRLEVANSSVVSSALQRKGSLSSGTVFAYHLVSADGTVVGSSYREPGSELGADEAPWVRRLDSIEDPDDVYVSDIYDHQGNKYAAYVSPVTVSDRYLVMVTSIAPIRGRFEQNETGDGEFTLLVNEDTGSVLVSERSAENRTVEHGDTFPDESLVDRIGENRVGPEFGGVLERSGGEVTSKASIVSYAPVTNPNARRDLEGPNWGVVVYTPQEPAYAIIDSVRFAGILATGVGIVLVLAIGAVMGTGTSRSIQALTSKAKQMEDGDLNVDFTNDRIDNVGRLYRAFDSLQAALGEQIETAREAEQRQRRLNERLTARVDEYSETMERAADGDLSVRLDDDTGVDQLNDLAADVNRTMDAIQQSIAEAKEFSRRVADESRETDAAIGEIQAASQNVATSMQQVNDEVSNQHRQLQETVREMNQLSSTTEEIASSLTEVADIAERTARTGQDGREAAQNAIAGMQTVQTEAESAVVEIEALLDQMEQIEEITEFIGEIAHETNMLALNANIEASRAGGEGKDDAAEAGFAVVADQIKDLASEAKESAEEIEDLVGQTQAQTRSAADEVRRTSEVITDSVDTVEDTVEALEQIATYAEETNTGVQDMNDATQQQAKSAEEAVSMVEESAQISERTTDEAENVAAAAEEQTAAIDQITDSADDLATQANELNDLLADFTIERDAGGATESEATVDD